MYTYSSPLAETARALRQNNPDLLSHINNACDHVNAVEPFIHALLAEPGRRERLISQARGLLEQYPDPDTKPPLFGILAGIKDIFYVDGFPTAAGSRLPPEVFTGPESSAVTRLRQAGVLVLGKTVTAEFAHLAPGPTCNPHNPEHTPGGSSSGSAAGVAAGFFQLALGTQTIGSVIRPAAFCGVVGFKPTFGRIPTDGVIACSQSVDHIGLFTQDIDGMILAASVLCNGWQPGTTDSNGSRPVLGVPMGPYLDQADDEALDDFKTQLAMFEEAGYTVIRTDLFSNIQEINRDHKLLVAAEMSCVHAKWFAEYEPLYQPGTAATIREGASIPETAIAAAQQGRERERTALEKTMQGEGIDLWVAPAATGPAPEGLETTGDPIMNLPWTYMGLPVVGIPAGLADNGMPLGLQLAGKYGSDEKLLAWAGQLARVV